MHFLSLVKTPRKQKSVITPSSRSSYL
ncbi:hypothetical protein NQ317_011540 [Molorchus minor]|uniref:Uncharacterized protein n=1 Tax=Molorchus minor TaxID=1323400 RepID=A0ABQ9K4Q3_9CUCU|nr:hypothetical protein NQ317_011540 [Molorchus minor]